jgi:hypothetical protein
VNNKAFMYVVGLVIGVSLCILLIAFSGCESSDSKQDDSSDIISPTIPGKYNLTLRNEATELNEYYSFDTAQGWRLRVGAWTEWIQISAESCHGYYNMNIAEYQRIPWGGYAAITYKQEDMEALADPAPSIKVRTMTVTSKDCMLVQTNQYVITVVTMSNQAPDIIEESP